MSQRESFYRNVIEVEILSNEPYEFFELQDLSTISYAITEGDSSGKVTIKVENEEVDGPRMAELLLAQGSDPCFLGINDEEEL